MKFLNKLGLTSTKTMNEEIAERDAQNARLSATCEDYKKQLTEAWALNAQLRENIINSDLEFDNFASEVDALLYQQQDILNKWQNIQRKYSLEDCL